MPKKKKPTVQYEQYFMTVKDYSVRFHSGLNQDAVDVANTFHDDVPVFTHYPSLAFECECFYPDTHMGLYFYVTVDAFDDRKDLKLSDCAELDDNRKPKFVTRRGVLKPVHKLPNGIGYMEKVRGENQWRASCLVSPYAVNSMISILSLGKQCYVTIDEKKVQRKRSVRAIDLQTERPE